MHSIMMPSPQGFKENKMPQAGKENMNKVVSEFNEKKVKTNN